MVMIFTLNSFFLNVSAIDIWRQVISLGRGRYCAIYRWAGGRYCAVYRWAGGGIVLYTVGQGGGTALCTVGCLAASLASTPYMSIAPSLATVTIKNVSLG